MVCRILKHFGSERAEALLEDFSSAVLAFDPEHASRVEITLVQAELNTLVDRLTTIETEVQQEHGETEELQQTYHRYLYAARVLQHELDHTGDPGRYDDIEVSLARLIDQLEQLQPELAQEQIDDRAVAVWTSRLRANVETLAKRLGDAQSNLLAAKGRTDKGDSGRRLTAATRLTTSLSAISVALDKMNREAAETRAEERAFENRLERRRVDRLEHDPHIAAALGTRSPKTQSVSTPGSSLRERLARLENPIAAAAASAA